MLKLLEAQGTSMAHWLACTSSPRCAWLINCLLAPLRLVFAPTSKHLALLVSADLRRNLRQPAAGEQPVELEQQTAFKQVMTFCLDSCFVCPAGIADPAPAHCAQQAPRAARLPALRPHPRLVRLLQLQVYLDFSNSASCSAGICNMLRNARSCGAGSRPSCGSSWSR